MAADTRTEQSHVKSACCPARRRSHLGACAHDRHGAGLSVLHQELRLWRRTRRLQFCELPAMPGDRLGAPRLLRRQSLFQLKW